MLRNIMQSTLATLTNSSPNAIGGQTTAKPVPAPMFLKGVCAQEQKRTKESKKKAEEKERKIRKWDDIRHNLREEQFTSRRRSQGQKSKTARAKWLLHMDITTVRLDGWLLTLDQTKQKPNHNECSCLMVYE